MSVGLAESLAEAYERVGVATGAAEMECNQAYRRRRSEYFRRATGGDKGSEESFRLLQQAYELIKESGFLDADAVKGLSEKPKVGYGQSAFGGGPTGSGMSGKEWYSKKYEAGQGAKQDEQPGQAGQGGRAQKAIKRAVKLTLEQAAFGATVTVKGVAKAVCEQCMGRRFSGETICDECSGRGFTDVLRTVYDKDGIGSQTYSCGGCNGFQVKQKKCTRCAGSGHEKEGKEFTLRVKLPPGVTNGSELLIKQPAERKNGGEVGFPGDIQLKVQVKSHDIFWFAPDGVLSCTVPVSMLQCIAQEEIEVPTLWGDRTVRAKPGVSTVELGGCGFPNTKGAKGKMRVHLDVVEEAVGEQYVEVIRQAIATMRSMGWADSKEQRAFASKVEKWKEAGGVAGGMDGKQQASEEAMGSKGRGE